MAASKTDAAGERDATYEELYDYAESLGNGPKAAALFAEANAVEKGGKGGYIVTGDDELTFSAKRFAERN
jgi:hypothetical protein